MLKRLSPSLYIAALLVLPLLVPSANARQMDRVTEAVDTQQTRTLKGHLPRWASSGRDLGAVSADVQLGHLTVVLARSAAMQAAFEQFLDAQQNPSSPNYHHWLTPQQVGTQFGLTDHDLDAVTGWLTSQGLRVEAISPDRTRITFSGASSSVGRALGTAFHRYNVSAGTVTEQRISIHSEPVIPAALAPVITSFHGLSEEQLEPQSNFVNVPASQSGDAALPTPQYTVSSSAHYLAPADFATIFNIKPLYNAGINGSGVKVAVIGRSRVLASDITTFQTNTGLSTSAQPNTIIPPSGIDPGYSADQGEQTLDVNRVMSTAPGAQVDLVVSASTSSPSKSGLSIAAEYEVNTLVDPIMTLSYGACEASAGASGVSYWDSLFSAAAAEGISVFVSSGDSAAAACATQFATPPVATPARGINYICSSSYATCVGGTQLNDTASPSTYWSSTNGAGLLSALSYIPEGAWNEPRNSNNTAYQIAGTGGGVSLYVTKPSWQTGTGVPADGFRDTPDLSLPSAAHNGYYSCLSGSCAGGGFTYFSGTSAAAPGMAGIMALVVQKLGARQGNFNPAIYRLAASTTNIFHDTTPASSGVTTCSVNTASICNNSTPSATALTGGLAGYPLTTGYDLATGWGSMDVANLIAGVSSGFYITSSTSPTITAGASGTASITITSHDTFAGAVTLTCAITSSPSTTASIAPTCLVTPGSVTLTSGSSTATTLTIGTTVRNAVSAPATAGFARFGGLTLLLLLAIPLALRKRLPAVLFFALLAAGLGAMTGCGGSSSNAAAKANGTIAGQYTATVTGTSGATTATGTVVFTVN
ncbi:MAG TPA: S53 family peptidase [Acidobacteriaceae bacterium]